MNAATGPSVSNAKCMWCSGSGEWKVSRANMASCLVCGGKGSVSVRGQANSCQQCRGTGKGSGNSISPCFTCAGTGWENVLGQ